MRPENELAGGVMPRTICSQWSLAAADGDDAQCADGTEADRFAGTVAASQTETLRFQIFCSPGKLVRHAPQLLPRVARWRDPLAEWAASAAAAAIASVT